MQKKIFEKLKQVYSHLGLGDEILQMHAESLAKIGLVTDENIDAVIEAQDSFLSGLQKQNDKRVESALKTAKEKFAEEETKKREAEKKKAEKEEAERKKAAEEEARRKELEKNTEVPEWYKNDRQRMESERKALNDQLAALVAASDDYRKATEEKLKNLLEENGKLREEYDKAQSEQKKKMREDMILSKARELGIPQYRIDEGFTISDDADEKAVTDYLAKVAGNIKTNNLPYADRFGIGDENGSDEQMKELAKQMVN
ncbi:MAG: hypothetical protein J6M59_10720 [Bacteroidaceae bacterium]|nr:hypothetical protein [Bacteroidaceae bacterium]